MDGSAQRPLYLASCDQHARSPEGTPMVAGKTFTAPKGYPALRWGCGPMMHVDNGAPRWLVLDADGATDLPGGASIQRAVIAFDGPRADALRYLHAHGAAGMPYLGRRRKGGDYAVLTVGPAGAVEADNHVCAAGGESSDLVLAAGATVAAGPRARVRAAEFGRLAAGNQSDVEAERFSLAVVGMDARVKGGDGALLLAGAMSELTVGAGGQAVVESGGRVDLGERAVGIGRSGTLFRGAAGALFVALEAARDGASYAVVARVGEAGVVPGVWYQVSGNAFARVHP